MENHNGVHREELEEQIMREISYFSGCMHELEQSNDPKYRALYDIYEGLLCHRWRQFAACMTSRKNTKTAA